MSAPCTASETGNSLKLSTRFKNQTSYLVGAAAQRDSSSIYWIFCALLYALAGDAHADEIPMFSVSGFGSAGVIHSSEDRADFTSSFFKPNGAGYSHDWSADADSLIAAQLVAEFSPRLSAVVQVISEQNYDNTYRPHFEWANIKYSITPDFSIRAGRIVLQSFLLSENRKVAFTYPWIRPPLEVYSLSPFTNNDGVDISYRQQFGELANSSQIVYGRKEYKLPGGIGSVKARRILALSNNTESGPFTLHLAYQRYQVEIDTLQIVADSYRFFGSQGFAVADKYDVQSERGSLLSAGISYDPGKWFAMAEWSRLDGSPIYAKKSGWYASAGYRFGSVTPYITYAEARASDTSDPGVDVSTLPPVLVGPAVGLNGALNSILNVKPVQNTVSLGLRWDFIKNADLKLQFDHSDIDKNSYGMLVNAQPDFPRGGVLNVFSAAVDFVF